MTRQIGVRSIGTRACAGRGFTLVELLIVMLIIGLVISIVLPALGGARSAARRAATQATCKDLGGAVDIFKTDHADRMPGYFDSMTMARTENAGRGFTAMENALLELSGGVVTGTPGPGQDILVVGPTAAATVQVDIDLIGADVAGNKVYYAPKGKNFVPQDGTENGTQASSETDIQRLPDVVDAWGNPLLLWIENEAAVGPIEEADDFARIDSGSSGNDVARFYWTPNAGFLASNTLGKSGKSQAINSLLGANEGARRQSALMALLGNPGFKKEGSAPYADILPTNSRGRYAVHSAGTDGIFLGKKDKSGRQYTDSANGAMHYGFNWVNESGQPHQDRSGNPTSIDIIKDFDDTVVSGGG